MNYRTENLTVEQREREYLADCYEHLLLLRAVLSIRQKQARQKRA